MPKRISLDPHLSEADLYKKYITSTMACERDRYHALWLLSTGKTTAQVSEVTRFHMRGLWTLVARYNKGGPESMLDRRRDGKGATPRLDVEQCKRLEEDLGKDPAEGGVWDSVKVAAWITQKTGKPTKKQIGWEYLKRFDDALRVPRRRHRKRQS